MIRKYRVLPAEKGTEVGQVLRPEELVSGVDEDEAASIGDAAIAEMLAAFPADDPVITAIDKGKGNTIALNDCGDGVAVGSEIAHDRPSGIEVFSDLAVVDIMNGEFIDTGVDEA